MKKAFIITLTLIISLSSFSQINIKDFLDYKQPDFKKHDLLFYIDFENKSRKTKDNDTSSIDRTNISNYSLFNTEYSFYKNTRKYQGSQSMSIGYYGEFHNDKENTYDDKSSSFSISSRFSSNNRMYFKNNWFYELNAGLNFRYFYNKDDNFSYEDLTYDKSFYKSNNSGIYTGVSIGKGRIEDMTDVIHALVLLKNLKKQNRINDIPETEEIYKFSNFITKIKSKRFFDSRHKKTYELEQVDSFLSSNNYLTNQDVKYFTTLEDMWVFAGNYQRTNGNRITFTLNQTVSYNHPTTMLGIPENTRNNDIKYRLSPALGFYSSKPINLLMQRNFSISLFSDLLNKDRFGDLEVMTTYQYIPMLYANYGYNYYPNTRTVVESYISVFNKNLNNFDGVLFNSSFNLNCKYYISPMIRFFIDSYLRYEYNNRYSSYKENILSFNIFLGFEMNLY